MARSPADDARVEAVGPETADQLVAAVRRFHGESGHAVSPEQADAIARLCAEPDLGRAWLLRVGGAASGYALTYRSFSIDHAGPVAILDDLWIDPALRGRGFGALLLGAVCEALRAAGFVAVRLEAARDDPKVAAFYRRCGFARLETVNFEKTLASVHVPVSPGAR